MPIDERNPKQGVTHSTPLAHEKSEKQAAAHQAVDILHEISTILVRVHSTPEDGWSRFSDRVGTRTAISTGAPCQSAYP
jgi:hypothetical protein